MKIPLLTDAWEDTWASSELLTGHHVRHRWLLVGWIVVFWLLVAGLLELISRFWCESLMQ